MEEGELLERELAGAYDLTENVRRLVLRRLERSRVDELGFVSDLGRLFALHEEGAPVSVAKAWAEFLGRSPWNRRYADVFLYEVNAAFCAAITELQETLDLCLTQESLAPEAVVP